MRFFALLVVGASYGFYLITLAVKRGIPWPQQAVDYINRLLVERQVPYQILPMGVEYYIRYLPEVFFFLPMFLLFLILIRSTQYRVRGARVRQLKRELASIKASQKKDAGAQEESLRAALAERDHTHQLATEELSDELGGKIDELTAELKAKSAELRSVTEQLDQERAAKEELKGRIEDFSQPRVLEERAMHLQERLTELATSEQVLRAALKESEANLTAAQIQVAASETEARMLRDMVEKAEALKGEIRELEEGRDELIQQLRDAEGKLVRAQAASVDTDQFEELVRLRTEAQFAPSADKYHELIAENERLKIRLELLETQLAEIREGAISPDEHQRALIEAAEVRTRLEALQEQLEHDDDEEEQWERDIAAQTAALDRVCQAVEALAKMLPEQLDGLGEQLEEAAVQGQIAAVQRNGSGPVEQRSRTRRGSRGRNRGRGPEEDAHVL